MVPSRMPSSACEILLCPLFAAAAQAPAAEVKPPAPPPSDAQCVGLPSLTGPLSFGSGELLEFNLDAMGAQAGKMTMAVLPARDGSLPIEVHAQTNTFFSKVRR